MIGRSTVFASALILAAAAPAVAASPFSAQYSFGDSLSDAGNVFIATGGAEPAPPYSGGRYSNGPVWTQDLAGLVGLGGLGPLLGGGTDYAFGGATTGFAGTINPSAPVPTLDQQVGLFLSNKGGKASSSALYTFSIGANDLFGILQSGATGNAALKLAAGAALAEAEAAAALEAAGAHRLIVFDVPNLGLTPGILFGGAAASKAATALSIYYNQQLFADLRPIQAAGLIVDNLNTFGLINKVVADPSAYGFTNASSACYEGPYTGGGSVCENPASYLFWDQVHPTTAAQLIIGTEAANLALSAPETSTWAMMLTGFAALGFAGIRRRREQAAQV
jgi:phospholipase/lecithinase/hemolysin